MGRSVLTPRGSVANAYLLYSDFEVEDFASDIAETLTKWFPSLYDADEFLNDECRAFLQNAHCFVSISFYSGVAAVSLVPKEDYHANDLTGLHRAWCAKAAKRFLTVGTLKKIGTFSNGESVYTGA